MSRAGSSVEAVEPEAAPVGDDEAVETLASRSAWLDETISQRVAAALRREAFRATSADAFDGGFAGSGRDADM